VLSGGQSFFDKAEIKDLCAYMRLIANPDDDPAFIRASTTPRRGVGAATLEKLGDHAGQRHISLFVAAFEAAFQSQMPARQVEPLLAFSDFINRIGERAEKEPAGQLLEELLAAIHYEDWLYDSEDERAARGKWENVREFVGWLSKKGEDDGKTLIELSQTISLMNLLEGRENEAPDAVRLSTLHAAKGLEYPHVYLVGVEEDILPHRECLEGPRLEEERRLMYVGITRARRSLTITWCGKRMRGGEMVACVPSRFLNEIDQSEIKRAGAPVTGDAREEGRRRLSALKAMLGK
jgi:ATP-dependent DNA helicase Rep